MDVGTRLDRKGIIEVLPHRDPFLFVDTVDTIEAGPNEHLTGNDALVGRRIVAWLQLTGKEEFFKGHFPGRPIMPGVLLIEAMAQASAVLAYLPELHGPKLEVLLVSAENVRFRRPVLPGDRVRLEVTVSAVKRKFFHFDCSCFVQDQRAAEAQLIASFAPPKG